VLWGVKDEKGLEKGKGERGVSYIWKITREFAKCVITIAQGLIIQNSTVARRTAHRVS
jgi:hypothetical protein